MAARAAAQLAIRVSNATLPAADAQAIARSFLDEQADLSRTWVPEKGDFLEQAHVAGVLPAQEWERYVHQAGAPALEVRPRVRFEVGKPPF